MLASPHLLVSLLAAISTFAFAMALRSHHRATNVIVVTTTGKPVAPTQRELALTRPWQDRLFRPLIQRLQGMGKLLTPSRNLEQLRHDLGMAGLLDRFTVIDFLGLRALIGAGLGMLVFGATVFSRPLFSALLFALVGFVVGLYLPNYWLRNQISKRQKAIMLALPDALDRMTICVDAGLGFEAALQKVSAQWDNELGLEFRRVIGEIRLGISRVDALHHLVERTGVPEMTSFVAVLVQADRLGIAISDVLHTQSAEMRIRRRQRANEAASKAPIKMLIPLVLFIFPAVFAVILGPAIPQIMAAFK
ncbi:MAG: type II secretion system F family protein [Chloroflexi bacterium]|nr:type II secretion system F family protein [Chloroflexota bacterium]